MPLSGFRKISTNTCLGFWDITEPLAVLEDALKNIAPANLIIPAYHNLGRQCQWLASRLLAYTLLKEFTSSELILAANAYGKPVLANSPFHISISHTTTTAAVILSDTYEVGIDIENIHPKVLRVRSKFLSESELVQAGDDAEKVMVYWCAKEALYKLYSQGQILFKEHLFIEPFTFTEAGTLEAFIRTPEIKKKYWLPYEKHPTFILTYCIDMLTALI